jgi:hypothetical protein
LRRAQWPNDRNPNLFHDIDPRSHAQWARPVSFNSGSMCEIEGQLQIEVDVKRLVNLYYSNAPQRRPPKYDNRAKKRNRKLQECEWRLCDGLRSAEPEVSTRSLITVWST